MKIENETHEVFFQKEKIRVKNSQSAVFFDRDGVVNKRNIDGYVKTVEEFEFEDSFFELFELINKLGFISILVTNQQCVDKGIITVEKLQEIHNFMQEKLLANTNYCFTEIYFCPYLADSGSKYRKPEAGMFIDAINKYDIDTENSWTIGDAITDMQAGKKVGTKTILIGDFKDNSFKDIPEADYIFATVKEVLEFLNEVFNETICTDKFLQ